jgi:hypothetical protein
VLLDLRERAGQRFPELRAPFGRHAIVNAVEDRDLVVERGEQHPEVRRRHEPPRCALRRGGSSTLTGGSCFILGSMLATVEGKVAAESNGRRERGGLGGPASPAGSSAPRPAMVGWRTGAPLDLGARRGGPLFVMGAAFGPLSPAARCAGSEESVGAEPGGSTVDASGEGGAGDAAASRPGKCVVASRPGGA